MDAIRVADDVPDAVVAIQHLHKNLSRTEDFCFTSKDGQTFSSHSLVLMIHSPVLEDLICGPVCCRTMHIEDANTFAIDNMIKYCYDEDVTFENIYYITETKKLADRFKISELSRLCMSKLADVNVNLSNVISVLQTAMEYETEEKEIECLILLNENKTEVFTSREFFMLEFENVLEIFTKSRRRGYLTEDEFLKWGIEWLTFNEELEKKPMLMDNVDISNIPLMRYLNIIKAHGDFFSNLEISSAIALMDPCVYEKVFEDAGTNTEPTETDLVGNEEVSGNAQLDNGSEHKDAETNTEAIEPKDIKVQHSKSLKKLTVQIIKDETNNPFHWTERVKITAEEDTCVRSMQLRLDENMKNSLFGQMKKDVCTFHDVDISYEGIYFLSELLYTCDAQLTPLQCIEALKAALYFKLTDISDKMVLSIKDIKDTDPAFLEGLKHFSSFFKDHYEHLLTSNTITIFLHPNFMNCSAELIISILEKEKLNIGSEIQCLLPIIIWLEGRNRQRWPFRSTLLSKIAFKNISVSDFKYAIATYPNFFTDQEIKYVLAVKMPRGENMKIAWLNLRKHVEWYNLKCRVYIVK